jgi:hypothetical protein
MADLSKTKKSWFQARRHHPPISSKKPLFCFFWRAVSAGKKSIAGPRTAPTFMEIE